MMIFEANSGEFWQIFARHGMKNPRNPQLERGEVCIGMSNWSSSPGTMFRRFRSGLSTFFSGAFA